MTYSCGIFETAESSMHAASIEKLDRLCRKLELGSEDHVLEIGTGWGSFAMHAASTYGCRVTTTTISAEQHALAVERIRAAGLEDRIEVLLRDYRDLDGQYDKLVSIEMIEAVGHDFLGEYFECCAARLRPGGRMALQAITMPAHRYDRYRRSPDFIQRYVFPGSCCPSVKAMVDGFASTPLSMVHLEDITPHYAETLRRWRERFFERLDDVRGLGYDETFVRLWGLLPLLLRSGVRRVVHPQRPDGARPAGPGGVGGVVKDSIINVILINAGWFACVLGAARGLPWVGPVVVAALVAIHLAWRRPRVPEILLLAAAAPLGYVIDSTLVLTGVIQFPEGAQLGQPSTVWMVALWVNLATAMNLSLGWLRNRLLIAAILGLIGGPLAYFGGARLGAITIGVDTTLGLVAIGVAWAIAMPALVMLARLTVEKEPAS